MLLDSTLPIRFALGLTLAVPAFGQAHDPRTAPTRIPHALFTIPGVNGPSARIGDIDGDGADELLVQIDRTLQLYFGKSGAHLASFADLDRAVHEGGPTWQVGSDVDGDGILDVAFLSPSGKGLAVEVRSSATGARIWTTPTLKGLPRALTWIGDIDGDGIADVALADPSVPFVRTMSGATGKRIWRTKLPKSKPTAVRLQNAGDRNGDGKDDLLLDTGIRVSGKSVWISGSDGQVFEDKLGAGGVFIALGDLDHDGLGDLAETQGANVMGGGYVLHESTGRFPWNGGSFPDLVPDRPFVGALGDLDGDGVAEIGVGDTNFHLRANEPERPTVDLGDMTLEAALGLESRPRSISYESGCAWILSGRTGIALMGVYGEPGSNAGLGLDVIDVGDQNGDGLPDVGVRSTVGLHVFASAAPRPAEPFDWLPGHWISEVEVGGEVRINEESWLEPAGGRMLGIGRTYVRDAQSGGTFEFFRIERDGDRVALFAQPSGRPATRFEATELGASSVLFTNPKHDFPTRIYYERDGDELRAVVGTEERPDTLRFRWKLKDPR